MDYHYDILTDFVVLRPRTYVNSCLTLIVTNQVTVMTTEVNVNLHDTFNDLWGKGNVNLLRGYETHV